MDYNIVKVENGSILHTSEVTATDEFIYEWGEFIGDKRALNKKGRTLIKKKEVAPPTREYQLKITLEKILKKFFTESKKILKEEIKSNP